MRIKQEEWHWNEESGWLEDQNGEVIIAADCNGDLEVADSKAEMIASTPTLLKALRSLHFIVRNNDDHYEGSYLHEEIEAILSKVIGEYL